MSICNHPHRNISIWFDLHLLYVSTCWGMMGNRKPLHHSSYSFIGCESQRLHKHTNPLWMSFVQLPAASWLWKAAEFRPVLVHLRTPGYVRGTCRWLTKMLNCLIKYLPTQTYHNMCVLICICSCTFIIGWQFSWTMNICWLKTSSFMENISS